MIKYRFGGEELFVKKLLIKIRRGAWLKNILKITFFLAGKLPVKKKTIIFESFHGKQFSDNPRAIFEYMLEKYPDYELIWSVDRRHTKIFEQKGLTYVKRFSPTWIVILARARYWVINSRLPLWIPKPKHTIYIQTWHGTPLKRLAADMDEVHMPGTDEDKYKKNFLYEASKWDYLVSPNAYSTEIFRRAFRFEQEIIESGYPRNDFLINGNNNKTILAIKNANQLPNNKKIILYAPTWRDNEYYSVGKYKFSIEMDLKQMQHFLGDDYIILLRMHYLIAENLDLTGFEGFIYDFSDYTDIRELYLISDILITDYSSVFFDYANLKRPILFYAYDLDEYRDHLRGFYFDFEANAPGPLVKTTEEIISQIKKIETSDKYTCTETDNEFFKKFCYLEDGQASKRVVETFLETE